MAWYYPRQLDRIETTLTALNTRLTTIINLERRIMADEAALDQALTDLGTHITELQTAAQSIIDKVSNLPDAPDLTDEIATIQNFGTQVQDTTTAITTAVSA